MAGSTQYAAIYSSLAILIIFMIWLYVSWIVVLVGASVSFYMQHTKCLMAPYPLSDDPPTRDRRITNSC